MVRVNLETVVMGSVPGTSLVILRPSPSEEASDQILPICIGTVEAAAIGKALSSERTSRPMTHALLGTVIAQLGGSLSKVVIDKVQGTIFYATLVIQRPCDEVKVDARPSDAIALAIRMRTPIYVAEDVLSAASFPSWVNVPKEQQLVMQEEFHDFVESLSPEDFA